MVLALNEPEWLARYQARLIHRGLTPAEADGIDPEIDLDYSPEDAADDEIDCMASDCDCYDRGGIDPNTPE